MTYVFKPMRLNNYENLKTFISKELNNYWDSYTGFNAPLFKRSNQPASQATLNVDWAVRNWISKGAPPEKLILGIGAYGSSFKLASASANKPGDAAVGPALAGRVSIIMIETSRNQN